MQTCANCERDIGNLEDVYEIKGQPVCNECNQRLNDPQPTGPSVTVTSGKITTEQTGKQWKKLQLFGACLVIGAIFLFVGGGGEQATIMISLLGFLIGSIILIYGRIMAWWHHG